MIVHYNYKAEVLHITDGDSVRLFMDYGFKEFAEKDFRLYGIDTPERGQQGWAEATAYLKSILPLGAEVVFRSYKPELHPKPDSFKRWLVDLYYGDLHINQALLDSGHAVVYTR